MVTDEQVRRLRKLSNTEKNQEIASSKSGMDPTTARRYLGLERLPSELKKDRPVEDREDPFGEVWGTVQQQIQESPGLEAKTLFEWLQREYQDGSATGRSAPCNGGSISEVDPIVWTKNRASLDGGAG
jgi:hypothetical protein